MMNWVYAIKDALFNHTGGAIDLPEWSITGAGMVVVAPIIIKLLSLVPWHTLLDKLAVAIRPVVYGAGVAVSMWLVKTCFGYGASVEEFIEKNVPKVATTLWGWFCAGLNSDDKPVVPVAPTVEVKK